MDILKITELLRGTIDPTVQKQAEEQLSSMEKIIGFGPTLLQIVILENLEMPVRQAGVIYFKNMVTQYWKDAEYEQGETIPFHIHEQDRSFIRDRVVDAVVHAPDLLRAQLAVCTYQIVKHDFPGRWTGIVKRVTFYLENPDPDKSRWNGALICLYQLVKYYEYHLPVACNGLEKVRYKKKEERGPLHEAMNILLPMLYERILHLVPDLSEQSVFLQKLILKIFYAFTQFTFSQSILTRKVFTQWMEIFRQIGDYEIPDDVNNKVEEDERTDMIWWKVKKWAMHILARIFERYGCPSTVNKEYESFAKWYIKTFSRDVVEVILKMFNQYKTNKYVSPRVLQQCFCYLEQGVGQAVVWKLLKNHAEIIVQNVIFPLMCYSETDEVLWNTDPYEYVRLKYDIYEDLVSPVTAAQSLLLSICKKRKDMLEKIMLFLVKVLSSHEIDARHKDGVFHMIGSMADLLLKKKKYKDQMERMMITYVFPEFHSQHGFMRARACWLLQHFEDLKFEDANLTTVMNLIQGTLLNEGEIPVKVEASMALSAFLGSQEKVEEILKPNMRSIVMELLKIIKETENDDLTNVMCKIVTTYTEQLTPIAADMCTELAACFKQVVESDDGADDKAVTAMGILSTIETLINCMESIDDEPNPNGIESNSKNTIMDKLEPITLQVVALILTKSEMEYYEEALSLIYSLTSSRISPDLWNCFEMLYRVFKNDGFDYFTEMMPALHNYITVDTDAFMSNETYLQAVLDICNTILTNDGNGEDEECHAAKLLEVVVLQCHNSLGKYLNTILEMAIARLLREVKTTELRTMLLQIVIASLYVSTDTVLSILQSTMLPNSNTNLLSHFINQWIIDADCFLGLHDRKLCVLGLCTILQLGPQNVPVLEECHSKIIPALILLFQGLKRAYHVKAAEENLESSDEEDDEGDEEDFENDVLESDEDELEDADEEFLEKFAEKVKKKAESSMFPIDISIEHESDDEGDDSGSEDETDETALESYTTPLDKDECEIDEYCVFKNVMQTIANTSHMWCEALTQHLDEEQKKSIQEIFTLADQRKAAALSKKIQEKGGYDFSELTKVPTTFNFGAPTFGPPQ